MCKGHSTNVRYTTTSNNRDNRPIHHRSQYDMVRHTISISIWCLKVVVDWFIIYNIEIIILRSFNLQFLNQATFKNKSLSQLVELPCNNNKSTNS
jgi:hypothetical protein